MFEITWQSFSRILIVGTLAYFGLIFFLVISGKRTLTKLNAFDLVVTVALGSTLATVLLSSSVSLWEGLLALGLLIFLQFIVTFTSVRWKWFSNLIKEEPVLLYLDGQFLDSALKRERILKEEVLQSARSQGIGSLQEVKAIVLETDGSMSIIKKNMGNTLSNVKKPPS